MYLAEHAAEKLSPPYVSGPDERPQCLLDLWKQVMGFPGNFREMISTEDSTYPPQICTNILYLVIVIMIRNYHQYTGNECTEKN